MSVVAGCRLLDGVIILADSRATISVNGKTFYLDNLQKILPFTPYIVIGFAGNVKVISKILLDLFELIKTKGKKGNLKIDPISFVNLKIII